MKDATYWRRRFLLALAVPGMEPEVKGELLLAVLEDLTPEERTIAIEEEGQFILGLSKRLAASTGFRRFVDDPIMQELSSTIPSYEETEGVLLDLLSSSLTDSVVSLPRRKEEIREDTRKPNARNGLEGTLCEAGWPA